MNDLNLKTNIQQLICLHDNDNDKNVYFIEKNKEWIEITEKEYNKIRGIK